MVRLFVYGTLLRGEENHTQLVRARFVGEGKTPACYSLYDLGAWPGLVRGGEHAVYGELYDIDEATLAALDQFEDHPRLFRRETIELADCSSAETYFATEELVRGRALAVIREATWRRPPRATHR